MIIRSAEEQDWPRIHPFFSTIVAAGQTYAYPDGLSPTAAQRLWMEPPPGRTVVAIERDPLAVGGDTGGGDTGDGDAGDGDAGEIVLGSAKMGPNRPGRGSHVATASFMVDPEHSGRGVGRALGRYAINWARAAGYRRMQFNAVVETNHAAVALWQSLGFEILTTVPEAFEHPQQGFVGLHVMFQCFMAPRRADAMRM